MTSTPNLIKPLIIQGFYECLYEGIYGYIYKSPQDSDWVECGDYPEYCNNYLYYMSKALINYEEMQYTLLDCLGISGELESIDLDEPLYPHQLVWNIFTDITNSLKILNPGNIPFHKNMDLVLSLFDLDIQRELGVLTQEEYLLKTQLIISNCDDLNQ